MVTRQQDLVLADAADLVFQIVCFQLDADLHAFPEVPDLLRLDESCEP